jgi:hypothetical protein
VKVSGALHRCGEAVRTKELRLIDLPRERETSSLTLLPSSHLRLRPRICQRHKMALERLAIEVDWHCKRLYSHKFGKLRWDNFGMKRVGLCLMAH